MSFVVKPTPAAWDEYQRLDAGLREELRRHIARAAEDVAAHVRRAPPPWPPDTWILSYDSAIVDGLHMSEAFADLDLQAGTMTLVAIAHVLNPPSEGR